MPNQTHQQSFLKKEKLDIKEFLKIGYLVIKKNEKIILFFFNILLSLYECRKQLELNQIIKDLNLIQNLKRQIENSLLILISCGP